MRGREGDQTCGASHVGSGRWGPGKRKGVGARGSAPDHRVSQLDVAPLMSQQSWHLAWLILSYPRPCYSSGLQGVGLKDS